jgi:hypothetical protein
MVRESSRAVVHLTASQTLDVSCFDIVTTLTIVPCIISGDKSACFCDLSVLCFISEGCSDIILVIRISLVITLLRPFHQQQPPWKYNVAVLNITPQDCLRYSLYLWRWLGSLELGLCIHESFSCEEGSSDQGTPVCWTDHDLRTAGPQIARASSEAGRVEVSVS